LGRKIFFNIVRYLLQLHNIHFRLSVKNNEDIVTLDLEPGACLKLKEIRSLTANDPDLQDLSEERIKELKDALLEHQSLKKTGAHPSNHAAAQDVRSTVEHLSEVVHSSVPVCYWLSTDSLQIDNLAECTGSLATVFVTWGHVDDANPPVWIDSEGAMDFFCETLDLDPWDVGRLFEQWACARGKGEYIVFILIMSLTSG
jgi:hypothetical protein